MPNEPRDMMNAVSRSLAERTGRSMEEWALLVEEDGRAAGVDPLDRKAVRAWLRDEHGMRQNSRWAVADEVARRTGWQPPSVEEYTDAMYAGPKAGLPPLHDAVVAAAVGLGGVEPQARATYVPLVHHSQLAAVGPGTRGRLRIGFRFRTEVPDDARLEHAKAFAQATHVINVEPVDADGAPLDPQALADSLVPLLRAAWEQN